METGKLKVEEYIFIQQRFFLNIYSLVNHEGFDESNDTPPLRLTRSVVTGRDTRELPNRLHFM